MIEYFITMKSESRVYNYLFIGLFLIVVILAFFVIKELIFAILYSLVLAFFFYPLYNKINSLIKIRPISIDKSTNWVYN